MSRYSRTRGLGLYPQEECFDPMRPSWLAYSINTPTEGLCNLGIDAAVRQIKAAQAAAAAAIRVKGGSDGSLSDAELIAANELKGNMPKKKCVGFQSLNEDTGECEFDPSKPTFIMLAIGSVIGIVVVLTLVKK